MQVPSSLPNLLNVAISLIGIYIAFALLASWVNERIATWLQLRSKTLLAGIEQIVGNESKDGVLNSPFITSLTGPQSNAGSSVTKSILPTGVVPPAAAAGVPLRRPPSYVSSAQFTSAVMEWLQRQRAQNLAQLRADIASAAVAALPAPIATGLQALATASNDDSALAAAVAAYAAPAGLALTADQLATLDGLKKLATGHNDVFTNSLAATASNSARELASMLNSLPDGKLRTQLLTIFRTAEGDVSKFVTGVQGWFDDAMDRVSGWYKRSNQKFVFSIGFALVLAFNVDTVNIFEKLSSDVKLAAQGAVFGRALGSANQGQQTPSLSDITKPVACPKDSNGKTANVNSPCQTCPPGYTAANAPKGQCAFDQSFLSQIPLGWPDDPLYMSVVKGQGPPNWLALTLLKLSGLLLSMVAVAQGAPFWFDLLGRVTSVRSTGPKPANDGADSDHA
jgi:hypothetical protein